MFASAYDYTARRLGRTFRHNGEFNVPKCERCGERTAFYMLTLVGDKLVCAECLRRVLAPSAPTALGGEVDDEREEEEA